MNTITAAYEPAHTDPRDIYLKAEEVHRRYTWGRTLGYGMLRSTGSPRAIGGRYCLDTLLAWDARVLAGELTGRPDARSRAAKRAPGTQPETAAATSTTANIALAPRPQGPAPRWCRPPRRPSRPLTPATGRPTTRPGAGARAVCGGTWPLGSPGRAIGAGPVVIGAGSAQSPEQAPAPAVTSRDPGDPGRLRRFRGLDRGMEATCTTGCPGTGPKIARCAGSYGTHGESERTPRSPPARAAGPPDLARPSSLTSERASAAAGRHCPVHTPRPARLPRNSAISTDRGPSTRTCAGSLIIVVLPRRRTDKHRTTTQIMPNIPPHPPP